MTDGLLLDLYGVALVAKADPSPLTPRGFDAVVLGMLRELQKGAKGQEKKAVTAYLKLLDRDWSKLRPEQREQAFRDAGEKMLGFGPEVGATVGAVVRHVGPTILRGTRAALIQRDGLKIEPSLNAVDDRMVLAAATHQALFVRDEFGKRSAYLSDKARNTVANGMQEGLDRYAIAEKLQEDLGAAYAARSDAYWRLIASVFTARARAFGTLSSFDDAGIETYEFESVLDERTTEVCRFMHGKQFSTGSALTRFGEVSAAQDPEEVKNLQPWCSTAKGPDGATALFYKTDAGRRMVARVDEPAFGAKDKVGRYSGAMSTDAMQKAGLSSPPLHGHCRSTIVPVFGSVSAPVQVGPGPGGAPPPPEPPKPPPRLPGAVLAPGAVTPPKWSVAGPPVDGVPPFTDAAGQPVDPETVSDRAKAALQALYGAAPARVAQLGGLGPSAQDAGVDMEALRAALLRASGGKKLDLAALTGKSVTWIRPTDLGRVTAPDKLDRDKVAAYVAGDARLDNPRPKSLKEAAAYPVAVRFQGKVVLYDGGERWVADQLRAAHSAHSQDPGAYVRFVDLDGRREVQPLGRPLGDAGVKATSARISAGLGKIKAGGDTGAAEADAREAFRDVLRANGCVSRDVSLRGPKYLNIFDDMVKGADKLSAVGARDLGTGAAADHSWVGAVRINKTYAEEARLTAAKLAADPRAYAGKSWREVNTETYSYRTLVHEELHGASRAASSSYRGEGVGMEEAATEILARKFTREVLGFKLTGPANAQSVPFGLPVRNMDGDYTHKYGNGGSYDGYINGLFTEVSKVAGDAGIHERIEQALLRTRQGKENDKAWTTGGEQIRAFVNELGLPKPEDGNRLYDALSGSSSPLRKK